MIAVILIRLIHALIIIWALVAPFSSNKRLLVSYVTITPFIVLHWILNDNVCLLSTIESNMRGIDRTESFVHNVIAPVYDVHESVVGNLIWAYTVITWIYAASKISIGDIKEVLFES